MRTYHPGRGTVAERWLPVLAWGVLLGGGTLLVAGLGRYVPPCVFREITGAFCPGCGSGRALVALSRFDAGAAIRSNALVTLSLPFVLGALAWETAEVWGAPVTPIRQARWLPVAVLVVVLAFWLLRNVGLWPLTLLAPR